MVYPAEVLPNSVGKDRSILIMNHPLTSVKAPQVFLNHYTFDLLSNKDTTHVIMGCIKKQRVIGFTPYRVINNLYLL